MTAPTFVDTNVLVYARDASNPAKQQRASAWLDHLWTARSGRLSYQVLSEYYVTVTCKLAHPLPPPTAREHLRTLSAWRPRAVDDAVFEAAWALEDSASISVWDALIVAAAQVLGCRRLLTEDLQHGRTFGDVEVVDPFRVAPP